MKVFRYGTTIINCEKIISVRCNTSDNPEPTFNMFIDLEEGKTINLRGLTARERNQILDNLYHEMTYEKED